MTTSRAKRILDASMIPGGPHGEFPRQLIAQIEDLEAALRQTQVTQEAEEATGGSSTFRPRIVIATPVATPHQLTWDDVGSEIGDEGMAEASGVTLPVAADYLGARATECPLFHFVLTTAYPMTIFVGDAAVDTLEIGSGAGGVTSFKLTVDGDRIAVALHDDRWRG